MGEDVKNDSLEVPSGVAGIVSGAEKVQRKTPLPEEEMGASGAALHEYLMETRGGFVSWESFTGRPRRSSRTSSVSAALGVSGTISPSR